jgi:hypothetical protein
VLLIEQSAHPEQRGQAVGALERRSPGRAGIVDVKEVIYEGSVEAASGQVPRSLGAQNAADNRRVIEPSRRLAHAKAGP